MPIYAYRCEACGFAKDVLQKLSDAQLTECPSCGQSTFKKQVTAAGFQLKGTGWYVTDFRGGSNNGGANPDKSATTTATTSATSSTTTAPATTSADSGSTSTPAASSGTTTTGGTSSAT